MKTIQVIIERGADVYAAYSENIPRIYATGESVEEVKILLLKAIDLYKKYNSESTPPIFYQTMRSNSFYKSCIDS